MLRWAREWREEVAREERRGGGRDGSGVEWAPRARARRNGDNSSSSRDETDDDDEEAGDEDEDGDEDDEDFVAKYVAMGKLLLVMYVGWMVGLVWCAAGIPPGCRNNVGPCVAMESIQTLSMLGVFLGVACDAVAARRRRLLFHKGAWPLGVLFLLSTLVMAAVATAPGWTRYGTGPTCGSPSTPPSASAQMGRAVSANSPAGAITVAFVVLYSLFVLGVHASHAVFELHPIDMMAYLASRAFILAIFLVGIGIAAATDKTVQVDVMQPVIWFFLVTTLCAFNTMWSLAFFAVSLGFLVEAVAFSPLPSQGALTFAWPTNCALATPASMGSNPSTLGWILTNISATTSFSASVCLSNPSGYVYSSPSLPPDLGLGNGDLFNPRAPDNLTYAIFKWASPGMCFLPFCGVFPWSSTSP